MTDIEHDETYINYLANTTTQECGWFMQSVLIFVARQLLEIRRSLTKE